MQEISRKERERQVREDDILNAAEEIFSVLGVDGASMEEIARKAQFTRKTVYQYFNSKEMLLSAVVMRGFKILLDYLRKETDCGSTGYDRLRIMGRAFFQFYKEKTAFFAMMNYSSRVRSLEDSKIGTEFDSVNKALFQLVSGAITDGITDGSIRPDIDVAMGTSSVIFALTGFFFQYSITGKTFTEYLSLDSDKFVQFTLDLLLDGFNAHTQPLSRRA